MEEQIKKCLTKTTKRSMVDCICNMKDLNKKNAKDHLSFSILQGSGVLHVQSTKPNHILFPYTNTSYLIWVRPFNMISLWKKWTFFEVPYKNHSTSVVQGFSYFLLCPLILELRATYYIMSISYLPYVLLMGLNYCPGCWAIAENTGVLYFQKIWCS